MLNTLSAVKVFALRCDQDTIKCDLVASLGRQFFNFV